MDLEVIRRILVEAKTTGVEQTTAQLKGLSTGYEGVTLASQKTETATESVTRKFQAMESRLDPASRAARQLAKDIATLDAALAQDAGLAQRHGELLNVATQNAIKMSGGAAKATGAMEGLRQVTAGVSGQLVAMAAGVGPVGVFLSAIPGWGMPAAVALSAISTAIGYVVSEANRMGDKAVAFNQLTQATGLTAQQFKAIKTAAAEAGVDSDGMGKAIEMLTFKLNDARDASGTLYKEMRKVDVGLADQLLTSKSAAEDINLIAKAWRNAATEAQRAAIARAAFGRQGMEKGAVLGAIADKGGIDNIHAVTEATDEQSKSRARLRETTKELQKETANLYATIATDAVLKAEHDWAALQNTIARNVAEAAKLNTELTLLQRIMQAIAQSSPIVEPGSVAIDNARINAEQNLQRGKGSNLGANPADVESWNKLGDAMRGVSGPAQEAKKSFEDLQHEAATAANKEKERIGLLGNAATAQEKANASLLSLKSAFLEGAFGAQDSAKANADYGRAVAEVNRQARALETTFQAQIQTLHARTAAEREAAAAATARAGGGGDAEANAQRAVTMEIEKQVAAHRDAMVAMRGQLAVAQAVTGAQKIAAQEAATYVDLIRQGRTHQQAAAEAAKQTEIALAQVNSAAKGQLLTLQDQYAVSSAVTGVEKARASAQATINGLIREGVNQTTAQAAGEQQFANAMAAATASAKGQLLTLQDQAAVSGAVTGAQKIQAEGQATFNNLVRQGVDSVTAEAVAEQQMANSVAAANAAVENQIISINESTQLIEAQRLGIEGEVRAQQAYNQAIRSGADELEAMALQQAVLNNEQAKEEAKQEEKRKTTPGIITEPGRAALLEKARMEAMGYRVEQATSWDRAPGDIDILGFTQPVVAHETAQSLFYQRMGFTSPRQVEDYQRQQMQQQSESQYQAQQQQAAQAAVQPFEMARLEAQIAGNRPGEISAVQGELAFYRSQPRTLENLQQIKSLTDALKELTDTTKDNTDALSGLYSRQFGQGFYDGGAAVGELIYGLDNNTGNAIDAMQHANDNNTRNQNTLLTNLSQNQINTYSYYGGGMVNATGAVESAVTSGFSSLTYAVQQQTGTPSPTTPSPTPAPYQPGAHIPGTPGYARGGSFTTAGYGGDDSNVVAFRVSPQRERVSIVPMNGSNGGSNGGGTSINNNNISINVPQGTNEFRSTAMHIADEIFNQVAVAGRRR